MKMILLGLLLNLANFSINIDAHINFSQLYNYKGLLPDGLEEPRFDKIFSTAANNPVESLSHITSNTTQAIEPNQAFLLSPKTFLIAGGAIAVGCVIYKTIKSATLKKEIEKLSKKISDIQVNLSDLPDDKNAQQNKTLLTALLSNCKTSQDKIDEFRKKIVAQQSLQINMFDTLAEIQNTQFKVSSLCNKYKNEQLANIETSKKITDKHKETREIYQNFKQENNTNTFNARIKLNSLTNPINKLDNLKVVVGQIEKDEKNIRKKLIETINSDNQNFRLEILKKLIQKNSENVDASLTFKQEYPAPNNEQTYSSNNNDSGDDVD